MLEEILGGQPRNPAEDQALFEAEGAGLGGYETDGEREVFFPGGGWDEREAEAEEVNLVYEEEEDSITDGGRNRVDPGGGEDEGWTQVARRRRKQPN